MRALSQIFLMKRATLSIDVMIVTEEYSKEPLKKPPWPGEP